MQYVHEKQSLLTIGNLIKNGSERCGITLQQLAFAVRLTEQTLEKIVNGTTDTSEHSGRILGFLLRTYRMSNNITIDDLAKRTGCVPSTLTQLEQGELDTLKIKKCFQAIDVASGFIPSSMKENVQKMGSLDGGSLVEQSSSNRSKHEVARGVVRTAAESNEQKKEIGHRIQRRRISMHLSIEDVANYLKISADDVKSIELGKSEYSLNYYRNVERTLINDDITKEVFGISKIDNTGKRPKGYGTQYTRKEWNSIYIRRK